MSRFPVTLRAFCRRCGAEARVPAFTRGRAWPHHCGAAMLPAGSAEVRIADSVEAMARGLRGFAEVRP